MSVLATNAITDASGGNTATINSYTPTESNMAGRNRIINGSMVLDQRNAGASITQSTSNQFPVDRWLVAGDVASKFTAQQSSTAPAGFINSLLITSSSAYTVGASESFILTQYVEGLNVADFGWGTANATAITVSFWVRSSLTGTFGGVVRNSASNRSYPFSYTISAANTFEKKSITIAGDTSGTWLTTNGRGLNLTFSMGAGASASGTAGAWAGTAYASATGATSVVGTSGATFYITGVQLEAGSVATPFERRSYGTELQLAQRYYNKVSANDGNGGYAAFGSGYASGSTTAVISVTLPVAMRSAPTLTLGGTNRVLPTGSGNPSITGTTYIGTKGGYLNVVVSSGLSAYTGAMLGGDGDEAAFISYSAEL